MTGFHTFWMRRGWTAQCCPLSCLGLRLAGDVPQFMRGDGLAASSGPGAETPSIPHPKVGFQSIVTKNLEILAGAFYFSVAAS